MIIQEFYIPDYDWEVRVYYAVDCYYTDRIIADLNDTRIKRQGISLSGGDPLHPQNVPEILALVRRILAECPGKDIWVWTGYKLDELNDAQREVVDLINVLVDGKFVEDLKDPALIWRGSSNQVVHHLR